MAAWQPSAVAADVLGSELGIEADTLAKFDHDQPAITPGTMILIDEAGMAGTLRWTGSSAAPRPRSGGPAARRRPTARRDRGRRVIRHLAPEVGAVRMRPGRPLRRPAEAQATLRSGTGTRPRSTSTSPGRVVAGTTSTAPDAAYGAGWPMSGAGRDAILLAATDRSPS